MLLLRIYFSFELQSLYILAESQKYTPKEQHLVYLFHTVNEKL